MNPIVVLMQKELATSLRSRMAVFTLVTLTVVFTLLPLGILVGGNMLPADSLKRGGLDATMLQTLRTAYPMLQDLPEAQLIQGMIVSSMQPLFLLIPLMIPLTLAVYSIIGEKQTRSLEALLATPISTRDLLIGKCLAAALPGVASAWVSYGVFAAAASLLVPAPIFTNLLMQPAWLLAVVLAMPASAALGVLLGLMVSSRATDPQSAQQVAGVIVLPVVALIIGQMTGLVRLSVPITLIAVVVLVAIDAALLQAAVRLFGRETILTRWK